MLKFCKGGANLGGLGLGLQAASGEHWKTLLKNSLVILRGGGGGGEIVNTPPEQCRHNPKGKIK